MVHEVSDCNSELLPHNRGHLGGDRDQDGGGDHRHDHQHSHCWKGPQEDHIDGDLVRSGKEFRVMKFFVPLRFALLSSSLILTSSSQLPSLFLNVIDIFFLPTLMSPSPSA